MVVNEENRVVVTETPSGDILISSPDGKNSDCVTKEAANAIIAESQRKCSGSTADLQPKYNGFVPPPDQAGQPLIKDDVYYKIESLLDNKDWIASNSKFDTINDLFTQQSNLTTEMLRCLVDKGLFNTIGSASSKLERRYLPLYRVEQKNKEITKLRKINIFLSVILTCTLIFFLTQQSDEKLPVPSAVQAEQTAAIQTDSVMQYSELHLYIQEYCKLKGVKIYPYSETVILKRLNEKKTNDIKTIKDEIEKRFSELQKR